MNILDQMIEFTAISLIKKFLIKFSIWSLFAALTPYMITILFTLYNFSFPDLTEPLFKYIFFFLESKKQIEKMKETHEIELKSQSDLIDSLHRKLQEQEQVRSYLKSEFIFIFKIF